MPRNEITFVLAGGGTGGHLFPALAVAEALHRLQPNATVVFAGTRGRIEARLIPQYGYRLETIWISGIRRKLTMRNFLTPLKIVVSMIQSFVLMTKLQPAAVLGTGGYVCGPVLFAATVLGIPTLIHESNSYPGVTTKMLASRVDKVFLAFEETKQWLGKTRAVEVIGTPTRGAVETASREDACRFFELDPRKPVVFVSGGSQGSVAINEAVHALLDDLHTAGIQLIWQTGEDHFHAVKERLAGKSAGWVGPFINSMELAYAAADVIVCRAGAATIAELTRAGKPAILIPYPHAVEDHQTRNARSLANAGAAVLIPQTEITRLGEVLFMLIRDESRRNHMREAAHRLAKPDAAQHIAREMIHYASHSRAR